MKNQIDARLKSLQAEYEAGLKKVADLDARRSALVSTLLRIEGAMEVLRELAGPSVASEMADAVPRSAESARLD